MKSSLPSSQTKRGPHTTTPTWPPTSGCCATTHRMTSNTGHQLTSNPMTNTRSTKTTKASKTFPLTCIYSNSKTLMTHRRIQTTNVWFSIITMRRLKPLRTGMRKQVKKGSVATGSSRDLVQSNTRYAYKESCALPGIKCSLKRPRYTVRMQKQSQLPMTPRSLAKSSSLTLPASRTRIKRTKTWTTTAAWWLRRSIKL